MKKNRSTIILALCTILIGALLIAFPANATKWLVMAIGALFLVPGAVSLLSYLTQAKSKSAPFPFVGIGSILFGGVLLATPNTFLSALLYLLGAFLVLGGLMQAYRLFRVRKQHQTGAIPYVVAALISIAGIVVIALNYKDSVAQSTADASNSASHMPSLIFGVASIVYGLAEIIYAIQFRKSETPQALPEESEPVPTEPQTTPEPTTAPPAVEIEAQPEEKAETPSPIYEAEIDSEY